MNHDLPPSYENIFGDNVQPPKYNEISRQVLTNEATTSTRIEIPSQNENQTSESVRRNQPPYGTIVIPSQNELVFGNENPPRPANSTNCDDFIFILIFCILLGLICIADVFGIAAAGFAAIPIALLVFLFVIKLSVS